MGRKTAKYHSLLLRLYSTGEYYHKQIAALANIRYGQATNFYHLYKNVYELPVPKTYPRGKEAGILKRSIAEAWKLYQQGSSLDQVGAVYGDVSREYVRQVFEAAGLKRRPRGKERIYFFCLNGHKLGSQEYRHLCKKCRAENKARRAKGLHFKKRCVNGHDLFGHNLLLISLPDGKTTRRCRTCAYKSRRKWQKKKK